MDNHGELGLLGESFDLGLIGRIRDDEYESRSGSDNLEGGSGEDQDAAADDRRPRKKKYHRHTPLQIQELEAFFKECPHPDEKQRTELSRRLALENKQVKFWFQNRRTQMKTQIERHENIMLRQENEKLRAENSMIKDAVTNPMCPQCGGPAILGQISVEDHQLRIENARLKDELSRVSALTNKFLGRPLSSLAAPLPLPIPHSLGFGAGLNPMMPGLDMAGPATMGSEVPFERSVLVELALAAMDEFMKLVQAEAPLWVRGLSGTRESLNYEEYIQTFRSCLGPKPGNFVSEGTRDASLAIINGLSLVETLMDSNRWTEMFPCLVARASTVDILSAGMNGTRNGTLQVMQAELQVLSPLVPIRPLTFLRFCKQHAEGLWAVVDVSIDINREPSNSHSFLNSRRLPSGCLVQDMPDGSSKVIWVEHSEYDENGVHQMLRPYLSSGMGFGSQRWLATLQRQCESLASLMSHSLPPDDQMGLSPNGRRSMVKLGRRMVDNFCSGVCGWTARNWEKLCVGEDVRVMTRKSMDDPGEPPGIILCAATSVWLPVASKRLFGFLSDIRMRTEWDILSNGGPMHEMVHISKGPSLGNHVSLLRGNGDGSSDSAMLILQETWTDESGSGVVYAPVDTPSITSVMHGGDSAYVALLPSGFAILPDGASGSHLPQSNGPTVKGEIDNHGANGGGGASGCLLTVGFQILVNSLPTAKLTVESVETVNNLISCTIRKIKTALHVPTSA